MPERSYFCHGLLAVLAIIYPPPWQGRMSREQQHSELAPRDITWRICARAVQVNPRGRKPHTGPRDSPQELGRISQAGSCVLGCSSFQCWPATAVSMRCACLQKSAVECAEGPYRHGPQFDVDEGEESGGDCGSGESGHQPPPNAGEPRHPAWRNAPFRHPTR